MTEYERGFQDGLKAARDIVIHVGAATTIETAISRCKQISNIKFRETMIHAIKIAFETDRRWKETEMYSEYGPKIIDDTRLYWIDAI